MELYDAIYSRQSLDRIDSISVESQIEYCLYETRGGAYKTFVDKGYSGKNTERPEFKNMLAAIRRGEVKRVIVYKLDRISRSILDFSNMMEEFQKHNVEFVSCTEKFDTSSPMGRAMLNICIVFAQLERETIQQRVSDAYLSRSRRGFYMGGRVPYGYRLVPYMIDDKKTSRYEINHDEAEILELIYKLYAEPRTTLGDVARYLTENNIRYSRKANGTWNRSVIGDIVRNAVNVRADLDVYNFLKDNGCELHNPPEDYVGTNGCYTYYDSGTRRTSGMKGNHIVLAPHEGIIPSDIWIKTRKKCMGNKQSAKIVRGKNTWLVGKIKCAKCGYALIVKTANTKIGRYFCCSHRMDALNCEGVGGVPAAPLEDLVLAEIRDHVKEFEELSCPQKTEANPKQNELRIKIAQVESQIESLVSKIADADSTLLTYINKKIKELDQQLKEYQMELHDINARSEQRDQNISKIRNYMEHWGELEINDKITVVDSLIKVIKVDQNTCEITWKI